jgi:hypothetical protein
VLSSVSDISPRYVYLHPVQKMYLPMFWQRSRKNGNEREAAVPEHDSLARELVST